ncbi:MAG: hypothetical protein AAB394_02525 [Patescibacteria group bacterium]
MFFQSITQKGGEEKWVKVCRIAMGPAEGLMPAKVIPNRTLMSCITTKMEMKTRVSGNIFHRRFGHGSSHLVAEAKKPVAVVACGMTSVILREKVFSPSIIL